MFRSFCVINCQATTFKYFCPGFQCNCLANQCHYYVLTPPAMSSNRVPSDNLLRSSVPPCPSHSIQIYNIVSDAKFVYSHRLNRFRSLEWLPLFLPDNRFSMRCVHFLSFHNSLGDKIRIQQIQPSRKPPARHSIRCLSLLLKCASTSTSSYLDFPHKR